MATIFRDYAQSEGLRSDRSAGDRQRHRDKVRRAIRDNIADLVAEEAIIGQSREKTIKVPIRGIKEYRFIFGDNQGGVGQGDGDTAEGQVVGKAGDGQGKPGQGPAGDQAGRDVYETEITLDELIQIMFEDLELPDMERRKLREVISERTHRRKGYRKSGIRVHMSKRRTAIARVRRRMATGTPPVSDPDLDAAEDAEDELPEDEMAEDEMTGNDGAAVAGTRFRFRKDDLRYHRIRPQVEPESNAVVICIMDTSGSMDTMKKYLARSFFFMLYQFVRTKYDTVEIVFVAHDAVAREVNEHDFFHRGESGGTLISSGYEKALEIIRERYHPSLWNIYSFHCSDGDNFPSDNDRTVAAANELCEVSNLFGYGEIKPNAWRFRDATMLDVFRRVTAPNFHMLSIERKEDVWPAFRAFLTKEKRPEETPAEAAAGA
ncbi:YeaH/YhbH family protein [Tistrella mobilis]|uniref:YeaH/YhbH family protein n=1 Tax=Tistrella mobilis TaxID=171437 RepID=UPI0035586542